LEIIAFWYIIQSFFTWELESLYEQYIYLLDCKFSNINTESKIFQCRRNIYQGQYHCHHPWWCLHLGLGQKWPSHCASGWIFGLIGYNLAYGIYNTCILGEPKWIGLFISLVMLCFYLTTILSALNPFNIFATDVSGEGHLSSLLMGILTGCYQTASAKRIKRAPLDDEELSMEDDKDAFRYKLSGLI